MNLEHKKLYKELQDYKNMYAMLFNGLMSIKRDIETSYKYNYGESVIAFHSRNYKSCLKSIKEIEKYIKTIKLQIKNVQRTMCENID